MITKQARAAMLTIGILCSASPMYAEWQWLSSLKAFFTPLMHQAREYPKLTAAFSLLSLGCIASIQYAIQEYRSLKDISKQLAEKKKDLAEQGLAAKIANHEQTHDDLNTKISDIQKQHQKLDTEITAKQTTLAQYDSYKTLNLTQITKENGRLTDAIAAKQGEQQSLQAQIALEKKKINDLAKSPTFAAQEQSNIHLALAVKNRPLASIELTLKNAQALLSNTTISQELAQQITQMRGQLTSIDERSQRNIFELLSKRYSCYVEIKKSGEKIHHKPDKAYRIIGITAAQGITRNAQEIEKLIKNHLSQNITDQLGLEQLELDRFYLSTVFGCNGKTAINPLAKENYDAFLLGEKEFARLTPSQEQCKLAQELKGLLFSRYIKLADQLKIAQGGAHNVSKK